MKLSRVSILENGRENLKLNVVLVVVLFLDSKALLFGMNTGYVRSEERRVGKEFQMRLGKIGKQA